MRQPPVVVMENTAQPFCGNIFKKRFCYLQVASRIHGVICIVIRFVRFCSTRQRFAKCIVMRPWRAKDLLERYHWKPVTGLGEGRLSAKPQQVQQSHHYTRVVLFTE
jgi:hypothetical protein